MVSSAVGAFCTVPLFLLILLCRGCQSHWVRMYLRQCNLILPNCTFSDPVSKSWQHRWPGLEPVFWGASMCPTIDHIVWACAGLRWPLCSDPCYRLNCREVNCPWPPGINAAISVQMSCTAPGWNEQGRVERPKG